MRNIVLLLILLIFIGCNSDQENQIEFKKGPAIIEGKVLNFKDRATTISFNGENVVQEVNQLARIDSAGNFKTEIDLYHPQTLYLRYEDKLATLYIKPDDKITLEFHPDSLAKDVYEVSGSNSITNQNIRDYNKFRGVYDFNPIVTDSTSIEQFHIQLEKQFYIEDSILTEYFKLNKPSEEFVSWAKINIKYNVANSSLLYYYHFDVNHGIRKPKVYESDFFPVDNDKAYYNGSYLYYINTYSMFKYFGDTVVAKYPENDDFFAATIHQIESLIKNEKPGLSKDIMLYNQFTNIIEYPFERSDEIWNKYESHIGNKELVKYLKERKKKVEKLNATHENILDPKANSKSEMVQQFWETIASKHKGKVLYIDIWATWCGPCRGEIPHAIELHDYYKGKPIEFVNLCLASNKDDWEKTITENHIKGDNYFFSEKETDEFRSEVNFRGYPTYMIIDKKGNLINKYAPRPSSGEEIKSILDRFIEE